jgi:hypothetical protein
MIERKSTSFNNCSLGESMNAKGKTAVGWLSVVCCWGTFVLAACGSVTSIPIPTQTAALRLEGGAVQVQDADNGWVPVSGETTFELVGEIESSDPWMVTGNTFATRDTTYIAEGLEAGDQVRIKGIILEDGIWLANSIELIEEQIDPTITLIGKVDSIDPWVVHGMPLAVTEDTEINGEIAPGMIVDVDILLREDGTWEVLSITPLSDFTEIPGCATVMGTIVSVAGNEIRFAGWPAITLGEDIKVEDETGKAATLSAKQMVLVVVCATEDGQFTITKVIVLKTNDNGTSGNGDKVLVCHKPDKKGGHTLSIAAPAVPAHLAHGDKLGPCP